MGAPKHQSPVGGLHRKIALSWFLYFALSQTVLSAPNLRHGTYFIAYKAEHYVVVAIDTREVGDSVNDNPT
jgi:hypothetical protein